VLSGGDSEGVGLYGGGAAACGFSFFAPVDFAGFSQEGVSQEGSSHDRAFGGGGTSGGDEEFLRGPSSS
jgi:hypothetical protein